MRSLAITFTILAGLAGTPALGQTAVPVTPRATPHNSARPSGARPSTCACACTAVPFTLTVITSPSLTWRRLASAACSIKVG